MTTTSSAPLLRALSSMPLSSSPCPSSAANATSFTPGYRSFNQGRMTLVSRPPLYARTIFFIGKSFLDTEGHGWDGWHTDGDSGWLALIGEHTSFDVKLDPE